MAVQLVAHEDIDTLTRLIVQEYQPDSIILFGSRARGEASEESDIDLLVVCDREKDTPRPRRGRELRRKLAKVPYPFDLLIYSREELERYSNVPQSFSATVLREGVVLYGQ
ncbi:MAG: nucleotidyltransferase domain-containing protein [Rectinemataceae bacterium]